MRDLRGVTGEGATEEEELQRVFRQERECLRNLIVTGQPLPGERQLEELRSVTSGNIAACC